MLKSILREQNRCFKNFLIKKIAVQTSLFIQNDCPIKYLPANAKSTA